MKILARLLALFLIMPVVELFLLLQFEEWTDQWTGGYGLIVTLGLILLTGVTGGYLAKREGLSVWGRLKKQLDFGGLPGRELMDGAIILVSGALLVTPGVLTDFFGLAGLFPPTRALIRKVVMRRFERAVQSGTIESTFGFGTTEWNDEGWDAYPDEGAPDASWEGEGRSVPHHIKGWDEGVGEQADDGSPPDRSAAG